MEEHADSIEPAPKKRLSLNKKVNLAFLLVVILAVVLIYRHQQSGGGLPDWPGDINAALKQAADDDRKILLFVASKPPSYTDIRMSEVSITFASSVNPMLKRENFITVLIQLDSIPAVIAGRYKINKLPTCLVLGPDGEERNRRTGFVAAAPFVEGFLDCTQIEKPPVGD